MNDLLTPLAVVGILLFVAMLVLVAISVAQEALAFFRLVCAGHVKVQATWRSAPLEPQPLPPTESDEPADAGDAPRGWGFER